ncbi:MAG: hypothetical protein ABIV06_03885 [Thermoanaerobaculia bacterium]
MLFFLLLGLVGAYFFANGRSSSSADNVGTRALAASLATSASFDLTQALAGAEPNYSIQRVGEALRIAYPPGTGILAAPVYAVARGMGSVSESALFADAKVEKAAAVVLCLLAVACFLILVRTIWSAGSSLAATALLVGGTPVLTTMSQGLWSHTGELVALAVSLLLSRGLSATPALGVMSGLAAGFAVWCRPTAVLLFPVPLAMLGTWRARLRFAIGALVGIAALGALNLGWFGSFAGLYGGENQDKFHPFAAESLDNLVRVLLSPSRGLVWFFPALLVSLVVLLRKSETGEARRVALAVAAVTVMVVATISSYFCWWGGNSVGPRLLGELSLPSALAFGAALEVARGRALRTTLLAAGAIQVLFSSLLHFAPNADAWNVAVAVNANPAALMSWKDSQLRAAIDRSWTYKESGPYFDEATLAQARGSLDWTPVELESFANSRYDLSPGATSDAVPGATLHLERLGQQPPPTNAHLRVMPSGLPNAIRVCSGETSPTIPIADLPTQKIDTLIQYRGAQADEQQSTVAGYLTVEFANGKETRYPLRFGSQLLLRTQLNSIYARHRSRFFTSSMSAPDALQRQRFSLSGKQRLISSLRLEMPPSSPGGCLYLLSASLGKPFDAR